MAIGLLYKFEKDIIQFLWKSLYKATQTDDYILIALFVSCSMIFSSVS